MRSSRLDGFVYYVPHDPAIAEARANGRMSRIPFVQLRTWSIGRRALHAVEDLGDADQILSDRSD